jgi:murein DD-endopeptidase MepM/ murein hydrolase activator NlpD
MRYTVQPGDTLGRIARKFGTSLDALRRANPSIVDVNRIRPRQELEVPSPGEAAFPVAERGVNPLPAPDRDAAADTTPADAASGAAAAHTVAWGARVSPRFKTRVLAIAEDLGCDADHLMACMAFETGETFSPSVRNAAGSGATGLIQFMPSIATMLGTTTTALAAMTAEAQLDYVARYFLPYRGRLRTVEDLYMAILWPAAIGKPADHVLFAAPKKTYAQNRGLDRDGDGRVTKREAAAAVRAKLVKGRRAGYAG